MAQETNFNQSKVQEKNNMKDAIIIMSDFSTAMGYACCAHRHQKRKYTNEPYALHCLEVANLVMKYTHESKVIAAAVLHDIIEDTDITYSDIAQIFGTTTADLVLEVTDVSKPSDGNRASRKALDRAHLAKSSPEAATIKLADMIDNTRSIVKYDTGFAKVYLPEKEELLRVLKHGNKQLWELASMVLREAKLELSQGVPGNDNAA